MYDFCMIILKTTCDVKAEVGV